MDGGALIWHNVTNLFQDQLSSVFEVKGGGYHGSNCAKGFRLLGSLLGFTTRLGDAALGVPEIRDIDIKGDHGPWLSILVPGSDDPLREDVALRTRTGKHPILNGIDLVSASR